MKIPSVICCALLWSCMMGLVLTQLNSEEKQEILFAHNTFRGQVIPTATNMQEMVWNDELAELAQNFSMLCRLQSNPIIQPVGQNYGGSNMGGAYMSIIQGWYNQAGDYNFQTDQCTFERNCDFYHQLVWDTSRSVGCGASSCTPLRNFGGNGTLLVCYYRPGASLFRRPYTAGASCSMCPSNIPFCSSNNLCTDVEPTTMTTMTTSTTIMPTTSICTDDKTTTDIGDDESTQNATVLPKIGAGQTAVSNVVLSVFLSAAVATIFM